MLFILFFAQSKKYFIQWNPAITKTPLKQKTSKKPGRIAVKYMGTNRAIMNPTIMKSPL